MYTRSKVVGSKLGASSASQDASGWRGELGPLQSQRQGVEATPKSPSRESLGPAGQGSTGAYTMIAPNESRRHQIQRIAAQELSNLEKWKEQNRAKQVYVVPTLLGGSQSESEVRQKQQLQLMQNKYQQKLKRQESVRIRKEAEEAELQKMKAIQREKSNKLEEKKQLQEKLRREAFREHHQYTTAAFLSRLDTELPNKSACQTAPCDLQSWTPAGNRAYKDSLREKENQRLQKMKMKDEQQQKRAVSVLPAMQQKSGRRQSPPPGYSKYRSPAGQPRGHPGIPSGSSFRSTANSAPVDPTRMLSQNKLREPKRQQQEEERTKILQAEHRRVNNAFLDRLQGKSQPGGLEQSGGYWNTNCGNSWGI
ncbi:epithelial-stromal interaction protein 1 isoform X2 [Sciurus carolinensis]|uniref:epithelial-stromal interaction protein 1 isoform X2 n=1 Tax=Sciurus carolinensis TaxID=30640 RepID=UPI001FB56A3B|nr:epithelial-stromal interaction protein 1 isoform X2 [Sciurus carolinensis]